MGNIPISNIEKLATLGALANSILDLDKLMELIIDAISGLVSAEAGSLLLLEGDELVFVVATGERSEALRRMRLPRGDSIAWWVVDNGRAHISNTTKHDPVFSGSTDRMVGFSTKSLLAVPIKIGDQILGVMEAVNKMGGKFTDHDRRALEAFAGLAAVAIRNARMFNQLQRAAKAQYREMEAEYPLIGVSRPIEQIRVIISRVASTPSTVLITGESGVGKEVVARQLHLQSDRVSGPFIKVSCPSFPETLLESELFGHEKGAYTGAGTKRQGRFEIAQGGTIFLDEIGELPQAVQAKLLRVLQENVFERLGSNTTIKSDARIIAATNRDLKHEIENGNFRQDLFFRLNVVPITIPPLRQRAEDIPLLCEHFIKKIFRKFSHGVKSISPKALDLMQQYEWPGNIRELENSIERIVVMHNPPKILPEHLPVEIVSDYCEQPSESSLPQMEKQAIIDVLRQTGGNQVKASDILGISRDKLRYRIKKYDINPKDYKS